ncbi:MAG: hypothetical protein ACTHM6_18925 [Tepidisphaeraceae bacterium]
MNRLLEILLGLNRGFLSREGDFTLGFNPQWPWQHALGATTWNVLLVALSVALVTYVYRREGRARGVRVSLAIVRMLLLAVVIVLLNRPVLTLTQSRVEPSVLAVMVDDSLSMRIPDVGSPDHPEQRLAAVEQLLSSDNARLLHALAAVHQVRLYRFDGDAVSLASSTTQPVPAIEPLGQKTQVVASVRSVLRDLQGQRVAGVVVLTDGRDMPQQSIAAALDEVKDFGTPVYPVPVGSEHPLNNIEIQQVSAQDAVFAKDITNIKATVRVTGAQGPTPVVVRLKNKKDGKVMLDGQGKPVEQTVTVEGDQPVEVELLYTPPEPGNLDLVVEAEPRPGEIDLDDNARELQMAVLDAKVSVLYVDGYPRWDYRYIKNEMIRDRTVDISCLLMSADPSFRQEGDKAITRFPETADELQGYDVVLFGDVDPRELSDAQLQLVSDFVARRGGGFGMVAGPRWSPVAWRGTPIEAILPVDITHVQPDDSTSGGGTIAEGFRPVVTKQGAASSLFRFFADRAENERYLKESWQPLFWYCRGVIAKPGVGEVMAEHPTDVGPDGRRAPIVVAGRYGAGRTMFMGIDESWRWRYYTGESIFDTYWVQQLRYLARSRKLGERKITLVSQKSVYDLGQQVQLILRVIDPQLQTQLPNSLRVQLMDADQQLVSEQTLTRQASGDTYLGSFTADRLGKFSVKLASVAPGVDALSLPIEVAVPKLELSVPQVDRVSLARLASETGGRVIEFASAAKELPKIPSAERRVPVISDQPLWSAPIALVLFVLLITAEWIARKLFGMV